jgi:hypothetical protein
MLKALLLPGFILIAFFTTYFPNPSRSSCSVSMSLSFMIFLYIIQLSRKSLRVGSKFLQISFTYARIRSGPNTLLYGTLDVTQTSSDNCLPILTLYKRPQRNSLTYTTTLESTPEAAIFVSIQSYGTKAFGK